jgi:hypothetical protein
MSPAGNGKPAGRIASAGSGALLPPHGSRGEGGLGRQAEVGWGFWAWSAPVILGLDPRIHPARTRRFGRWSSANTPPGRASPVHPPLCEGGRRKGALHPSSRGAWGGWPLAGARGRVGLSGVELSPANATPGRASPVHPPRLAREGEGRAPFIPPHAERGEGGPSRERGVGWGSRTWSSVLRTPHPAGLRPSTLRVSRGREKEGQLVPNFSVLMASKSCTPPPTRFVV